MKRALLLFTLVLFSSAFLATNLYRLPQQQLESKQESIWKTEYKDDFILIQSKIIVYESLSDGIKHERIVFKYTNFTKQSLTISFNRNLFYNGKCYGCEQPERKYTVQLTALETKEYSDKNKNQEYFIFSKDLQGFITNTLDTFHIVNLEKK